jgi:hypothetical protein
MLSLTRIRELDLSAAPAAGRPLHVSAASGLVRVGSFIYVVVDDELHLGVFRTADSGPGHLIRILEGQLPGSKLDRKQQKPDFEALTLLAAFANFVHGALLALGSGSTRSRRMGVLLGLDAQGAVHGPSRAVDLSPVFAPLDDAFPSLNIEGAIVSDGELRLFQRGNKRHPENAVIRFQLSPLLDMLAAGHVSPLKPSTIDPVDLGKIDGIPLCFTDAAALPDGDMVFTAIAEDTSDAYNDGICVAAALGLLGRNGQLRWLRRLDRPYKVEGVDARSDGDLLKLLLVTDADDPDIPAVLYSATIR